MNIYYNIDEYIWIYHRPYFISDNLIVCFTILDAKMVHEDNTNCKKTVSQRQFYSESCEGFLHATQCWFTVTCMYKTDICILSAIDVPLTFKCSRNLYLVLRTSSRWRLVSLYTRSTMCWNSLVVSWRNITSAATDSVNLQQFRREFWDICN